MGKENGYDAAADALTLTLKAEAEAAPPAAGQQQAEAAPPAAGQQQAEVEAAERQAAAEQQAKAQAAQAVNCALGLIFFPDFQSQQTLGIRVGLASQSIAIRFHGEYNNLQNSDFSVQKIQTNVGRLKLIALKKLVASLSQYCTPQKLHELSKEPLDSTP